MKVWNYVVLCATMVVLLQVAGIKTGGEGVANAIGYVRDTGLGGIIDSAFWKNIFNGSTGLLVGIILGGVIGYFTGGRGDFIYYFRAMLITGTFVTFTETLVDVGVYGGSFGSWIAGIILILFVPLLLGFAWAAIDFFGGTD